MLDAFAMGSIPLVFQVYMGPLRIQKNTGTKERTVRLHDVKASPCQEG